MYPFKRYLPWRSLQSRRGIQMHSEMKGSPFCRFACLCFALATVIVLMGLFANNDEAIDSQETNKLLTRMISLLYRDQQRDVRHDFTGHNNPVIIYWTKVFDNPVLVGNGTKWPYFHLGNRCPVPCTLTTDHSRKDEAAAIVVHARNIEEMPAQNQRDKMLWVLHSNESPPFTPVLRSANLMAKFNFYLSYRLDSDFPVSLFSKPSLKILPVSFHEKRQVPAVALYSHCEPVRTAYLVQLMRHMAVSSYGGCLHNTELPENVAPRTSPNYAKSSVELYKNYKFTIVFMNSDCDYYVDEKLYYALSAGSVPVFMGTDKIDEFLPGNLRNAIIRVKDFATPELLAAYLKYLAGKESAYNTYLRWKYEGYRFPPDYNESLLGQLWDGLPVFCRLCAELYSGNKGRNGLPVDDCPRRSLSNWIRHRRRTTRVKYT